MTTSTFKPRLVTGVFIGAVMIGSILAGKISATVLLLVISGMCCYELYRMTVTRFSRVQPVLFTAVQCIPLLLHLFMPEFLTDFDKWWVSIVSIPVIGCLYLLGSIRQPPDFFVKRLKATAIAELFITGPVMFGLRIVEHSPIVLLGVFILLWSSDVGAYLVGSRLGKNKLAPMISPGKTWEGVLGGAIVTILVALGLSHWLVQISMQHWLICGGLVIVFGTFGDLMQSAIKRAHDVKDSGNLLPGHGGFYDRFDSFLGCVPWVAFYLLLFAY